MSLRKRFPLAAAIAYLFFTCTYLVYFRHIEYFVDDWFLMRHFRQAGAEGWRGVAHLAEAAAANQIYPVFRMQWLSILWGFLITPIGGYSARFNFALLLLLHTACAWLLCQALWRLGVERGLAFLAGAFYLLAPTVHFALFTYLTNPFFVLSTFWIFLMLWWFAARWTQGRLNGGAVAVASVLAVAAIFSGEQVFLLAWGILPLATACFPRTPRRPPFRAIAAIWAAMAVAAGAYLLWINRAPVREAGLSRRYEWTWKQLQSNWDLLSGEMQQLSGFTSDALFRVHWGGAESVWAVAVGAVLALLVWAWQKNEMPDVARARARVWLFAAAGILLAYAPVLWISFSYARFRYHYAPSPYLGLAAAMACWLFAGRRGLRWVPALLGGVVAGFFSLNAVADLRQCWIPQSEQHRALEARLRQLKDLAPGDILVIAGTPFEIGTAQHFTLHSSVSADPFVEWATGVAPLEVGEELRNVNGRPVLWERHPERRISDAEIARTHVLVSTEGGRFSSRDWVALETHSGRFRLLPLKGTTLEAGSDQATFSRDQLAFLEPRIYFPR